MHRPFLLTPTAQVLLALASTTAGRAQDLIPECYTASSAWPVVAIYDSNDEGKSPYLSPRFETLQMLIAKAGAVPGLTDSARDDRLHQQVAALWATEPERYEMLLAYLIARGGHEIVLDGGGLMRAVWLYQDFSGRARPLFHYYEQSEPMERLPFVLEAITQPLAADEQAAVLTAGCNAAWLLAQWNVDKLYWKSRRVPHVLGTAASSTLWWARRISSGRERELLRQVIVSLNSQFHLGIPVSE